LMQGGIQKVSRVVTGEWPAGTVRSMHSRRKSDDQ
jgi:hypothetical protein